MSVDTELHRIPFPSPSPLPYLLRSRLQNRVAELERLLLSAESDRASCQREALQATEILATVRSTNEEVSCVCVCLCVGGSRGGELCVVGALFLYFTSSCSFCSSCAVGKRPPLSTRRSGTIAESTSGETGEVTGDVRVRVTGNVLSCVLPPM